MSRIQVAVETPQHAGMDDLLDYESEHALAPGSLVLVPLGRRVVPGIVWAEAPTGASPVGMHALRPVQEALKSLPPLPAAWCALVAFAARYYQRSLGELALAVLPPELRKLDDAGLLKRLRKLEKQWGVAPPEAQPQSKRRRKTAAAEPADEPAAALPAPQPPQKPALTPEQAQVLSALLPTCTGQAPPACHLLHGVTGSGKTEAYLRAAEAALDAGRQALVLVP